MIRKAKTKDSVGIASIYNHYILNSVSTFEEKPVEELEMLDRIKKVQEKFPWLVYEDNGLICGYAYATDWKSRSAYKHTVESSVYLDPGVRGKGIGSALYASLLKELGSLNIRAIIGGISLPNKESIALHEKFGFEKVGEFKDVGFKFNQWVNVGYWELILK